jgi:hypothetical protein
MGLTRVNAPQYASESDYVQQMQAVLKALKDDLQYIMDQFEDVTPAITMDALRPTFDKSQGYCPVLTGDLKNSGYLEDVGFRGQPRVEMGYAKGGIPRYAVLVHEQVEVPHRPPTRSKFLEAAINEDYGEIIDRVSEGYKRFMGI